MSATVPATPNRPWVEVRSSNVKRAAYDDARRELYVEFNAGATYVYADVPLEIYTGLLAAQSAGGFLAARVKGTYSFRRV